MPSELVSVNATLAASFFYRDFYEINLRRRKFLPHPSLNLSGDMFRQQFRARVHQRQQNHIAPRQQQSLFFVDDLDRPGASLDFDDRAFGLNQSAVIQIITDLFHQRLKSDEVKHDPRAIKLSFHGDRNLIVMAMQRFSLSVGKDQKMGGSKIEIILGDLDAEAAWHFLDVS